MSNPSWQFEESKGTENEDTKEEFFSNAEVISEVSGLVRESVQNSLDEVLDPSKPTRMVFTVGLQTPDITDRYFGALYPHLAKTDLRELPAFDKQSKFLVIEDFNTLGMEGSTFSTAPTEAELAPGRPYKNSYWFFTWKTGASNKPSGKRGSWGVGKIIFRRASSIKSYLVLSNRRALAAPQGDTAILFGRSIVKYRTVDEKRFAPDCQWMVPVGNGPIPCTDSRLHDQFRKDWSLTRGADETGTSIVIPFVRGGLSAAELTECIIRDYFISILSGLLECQVSGENGSSILISKDTITSLISGLSEAFDGSADRTKIELGYLSAMYLAHLKDDVVNLSIPLDSKQSNNWNDIQVPDSMIQQASDAFNADRVLRVKIQVRVPQCVSGQLAATTDEFEVLLQRIYDIRSSTVFSRQGLLIPSANPRSNLPNFISVVLVGDMTSAGSVSNSIASLLRSAEGPSHEKWSTSATNFKGQYSPMVMAEKAISWVKGSVRQSVRLLMGQDDQQDDTALSKFFPLTESGAKPGAISVELRGARDKADDESGELFWRVLGVDVKNHTLICIAPTPEVVDQGSSKVGGAKVSLKPRSVVHRFQLKISDGSKEYLSNVFSFRPVVEREPARVEIVKCDDGFFIQNKEGRTALDLNEQFTMTVEYRRRRGSGWESEDFLLADLFVVSEMRGLRVLQASDNFAKFEVVSVDFHAKWLGFDPLRDLKIATREWPK